MPKFSDRFKQLRTERRLSQQNLADQLGFSKSSVNMYERGEREPGLESMETIADYFNVRLTHVYLILNQNPEGAFTTSKGNPVKSQDAMEKLDKMAQNLGELIDKENELLKGAIKNVTAKQK